MTSKIVKQNSNSNLSKRATVQQSQVTIHHIVHHDRRLPSGGGAACFSSISRFRSGSNSFRTPSSARCTAPAVAAAGATTAAGAALSAVATAFPALPLRWYRLIGALITPEADRSKPRETVSNACLRPSRVPCGWEMCRGEPFGADGDCAVWVWRSPESVASACCRSSCAPAASCAPRPRASRDTPFRNAAAPGEKGKLGL